MQLYSYDDFYKKAQAAGLLGEFSDADLKLAQQNPDVGMSILSNKQDWHAATTDDQRALINAETNKLRKGYGNYAGGANGGGFTVGTRSPSSYTAPTWEDPYKDQISGLQSKVQGAFSYDADADPNVAAYKKMYAREGDRATKNALGTAAASTGGIVSTAAVTAASQAGQYYASQMADKMPELRQQAYNEFMQEKNADLALLTALENARSADYSRSTDQRNFGYSQQLDDLNFRQTEETTADYKTEQEREKLKDKAELMASLGDFSLYEQLGYTPEQIQLMKKSYPVTSPKLNEALYGVTPASTQTQYYYGGGNNNNSNGGEPDEGGDPGTDPNEGGPTYTLGEAEQIVKEAFSAGQTKNGVIALINQLDVNKVSKNRLMFYAKNHK